MEFKFRNCNDAFATLVQRFHERPQANEIVEQPSRVGHVRRFLEPVMVTYTHPRERVLFNRARDCNPFFHLFEALWMLAGRNDVESLAYYNPRMREFSDDGETLHGAYGHRWRKSPLYSVDGCCEADQLLHVANNLRADSNSRREVLEMWDVEKDLASRVGGEKDLPCNLNVKFSVREELGWQKGVAGHVVDAGQVKVLDMSVDNRSNDLVWGMLGANVVHFSMLQEYMAARIGVEVGRYTTVTNNLHVYTERFHPEEWLADRTVAYMLSEGEGPYPAQTVPLVQDPERFDREVVEFVDKDRGAYGWQEPFFTEVALPMMCAFDDHKQLRDYDAALRTIAHVASDDWRIAGENWLRKRAQRYEDRNQHRGEVRNEL